MCNIFDKKAAGDISAVVEYSTLSAAQKRIFYPVERTSVAGGLRIRFD